MHKTYERELAMEIYKLQITSDQTVTPTPTQTTIKPGYSNGGNRVDGFDHNIPASN